MLTASTFMNVLGMSLNCFTIGVSVFYKSLIGVSHAFLFCIIITDFGS